MTHHSSLKIGIVGAGAFGTALGDVLCAPQRSVLLYSLDPNLPKELSTTHTNSSFLPGVALNPLLQATTALEDMSSADLIILAVPSAFMRNALESLLPFLSKRNPPLISVTKGLDPSTGWFMSRLIQTLSPTSPMAVLTGPSYVLELVNKEPTTLTLACAQETILSDLSTHLSAPSLILDPTTDVIGAQIGGVLKNVIAVASGFVRGKGYGENTRAHLMIQGLAEMKLLGDRLGAESKTFVGPSGLGDLLLTAMSDVSRNTSFGRSFAEGKILPGELSAEQTVEGVSTAYALSKLTQTLGIHLPICGIVVDMITNKCSHQEALDRFFQCGKK